MSRLRPLSIGVATAALLATFVAPASAGSATTHWVDDDGRAGPSGCGQSTATFGAIQDAIDAADPGDTVLVCPGRYEEQLTIGAGKNGLTVRATRPWVATVLPPDSMDEFDDLVTIEDNRRVTVQWLRLVLPTGPGCTDVTDMVQVTDARAFQVRGLRILATGPDTYDGDCAYAKGVDVDGRFGLIAGNLIKDFNADGIEIGRGRATIRSNSIRYFHEGASDTGAGGDGIDIDDRAGPVVIVDNVIKSLPSARVSTRSLADGIRIYDAVPGSVVRNNRITYVDNGIIADGSGLKVVGNTLRGTNDEDAGIDFFDVSDSLIRGNRIFGFQEGIDLSWDSDSNEVRRNDARGNVLDCLDSGTANTWVNNLGDTSDPTGLCESP
jgi:hypothetical protein